MGNAIEFHVVVHMQKAKDPTDAEEAERIRDALIAQVFRIASQIENEETQKKGSN